MQKTKQTKLSQELIVSMVVLISIGWLLYTYKALLGPLLIACLVAYLLYPGVTWLSDHTRINRHYIVLVVYLGFIILMVLMITFLAPVLVNQFFQLTIQWDKLPGLMDMAQTKLASEVGFVIPIEELLSELRSDLTQLLKPDRIFRILQGASTNIVWLLVIVIASFYLLRDWENLREWFFDQVPQNLEPDLRRLHQNIKGVWHTYLRGQLLVMTILGTLSGIGAMAIGIPGALFLGFLAGTLALIPSVGPAIATIIAAIVAGTQGSNYWEISNLTAVLLIVIVFQGIQLFEGFWLTPHIMSRRLNLHPGLVLIAIVGTLFTLGALMALIIVPLLGTLELIFHYVRYKREGSDPWAVEEPSSKTDLEAYFLSATPKRPIIPEEY